MPRWFWNLTWSDWWACEQGIALAFAVLVASYQLWKLRRDQCGWETLKACDRYENDHILHDVLLKLRDARDCGELQKSPRKFRAETTTLMNYFEGIAIGRRQGFYNAAVIRDHLEFIVRDHAKEFLNPHFADKMELDISRFSNVTELIAEWDRAQRPWYKF